MQQIEIPREYIYYGGIVIDPQTFEPIHAFKVDKKYIDFFSNTHPRNNVDIIVEYTGEMDNDNFCSRFTIKSGGTFSDDLVKKSDTKDKILEIEYNLKCKLKFVINLYDDIDFPVYKDETIETGISLKNSCNVRYGKIETKIHSTGHTNTSLNFTDCTTEVNFKGLSVYDIVDLKNQLEEHIEILLNKKVIDKSKMKEK